MSFRQFLAKRYDFSSALIHLSESLTDSVISWGFDNVHDSELFLDHSDPTFGREDDAHITLLYGIHTGNYKDLANVLSDEKSFECHLGPMSLFTTNSKFDVLKVEVHCDDLHRLHKKLRQHLECSDHYPLYVPHVTIAYMKKGDGHKFAGDATFNGEQFTVTEVVFSSKIGTQTPIRLGAK